MNDTIILYSTGCPRCLVLEKKMDAKNIQYTKISNIEEMQRLGIMSVPVLKVGNDMLQYVEAVKYINEM